MDSCRSRVRMSAQGGLASPLVRHRIRPRGRIHFETLWFRRPPKPPLGCGIRKSRRAHFFSLRKALIFINWKCNSSHGRAGKARFSPRDNLREDRHTTFACLAGIQGGQGGARPPLRAPCKKAFDSLQLPHDPSAQVPFLQGVRPAFCAWTEHHCPLKVAHPLCRILVRLRLGATV